MPDPEKPVTPEIATPGTPAAQTTPEGGALQEAPQEQPKFVTSEELDRRLAEQRRQIINSDKERARQIRQEVDAIKKRLGATGVQLDATQEQALTQQVADELLAKEEQPTASGTQPAADDVPPEIVPALQLMQERGVTVAEEDPEYKEFIEPQLAGPKVNSHKLYSAMEKAIDAKTARLNLQKGKANLRTPAGTGGAADLDDISNITDSKQLYRLGEERMARSKR